MKERFVEGMKTKIFKKKINTCGITSATQTDTQIINNAMSLNNFIFIEQIKFRTVHFDDVNDIVFSYSDS